MDELQLFGKPDTAERKISFEIVSTATKIVLQHIGMPSQQSNTERTSQKITQSNLDGYLKLVASRRCVTILSCQKFSYLRGGKKNTPALHVIVQPIAFHNLHLRQCSFHKYRHMMKKIAESWTLHNSPPWIYQIYMCVCVSFCKAHGWYQTPLAISPCSTSKLPEKYHLNAQLVCIFY